MASLYYLSSMKKAAYAILIFTHFEMILKFYYIQYKLLLGIPVCEPFDRQCWRNRKRVSGSFFWEAEHLLTFILTWFWWIHLVLSLFKYWSSFRSAFRLCILWRNCWLFIEVFCLLPRHRICCFQYPLITIADYSCIWSNDETMALWKKDEWIN